MLCVLFHGIHIIKALLLMQSVLCPLSARVKAALKRSRGVVVTHFYCSATCQLKVQSR